MDFKIQGAKIKKKKKIRKFAWSVIIRRRYSLTVLAFEIRKHFTERHSAPFTHSTRLSVS
jgi:hypothetical protein